MNNITIIERAYELARFGSCETLDEVRAQLKRERYDLVDSHLGGPTIGRQLRSLIGRKRDTPITDVSA